MAEPQPAVGNNNLNNGVGALTGLMGLIPGLSPVTQLISGGLGVASAANGVGTGSNALDEGVNAAGGVAGILGGIGTVAEMLGVSTGVTLGGVTTIGGGTAAATTGAGAAIGGAAAVGQVAGAAAAGYGYGNLFNSVVQSHGFAGQGSDGKNRTFSDMAGDHGWGVHEAIARGIGGDDYAMRDDWVGTAADVAGHVGGIGTVIGESVLGTGAAIATAPLVIGDAIGSGISSLLFD